MKKRILVFLIALALFIPMSSVSAFAEKSLVMATTTSTDNTGLLDYLMPEFMKDTGINIVWTAVGTGKALKMGENCDVDVLMVHAPQAEMKYISNGYGIDRKEIMYNDFIIVGPKSDPAAIKGMSPEKALKVITAKKAVFASRGDNSGTNKKEKNLWKKAGFVPPEKENWYVQTGQGMLATLNIAAEKKAYTLTDRGTYIKYMDKEGDKLSLDIVVEGSDLLKNQYSVMIVNPGNCKDVKKGLALKFQDWMISAKAQKMIGDFRLLGKSLFIPNAR